MNNLSKTSELKQTVEMLDATAPRIDRVDHKYFDEILNNTDFTNCPNTLEVMKLFYEKLWSMVIFPLSDEINLKDRELGRLIVETVEWQKKAEKAEAEAGALRERLQEGCSENS